VRVVSPLATPPAPTQKELRSTEGAREA